MFPHPLPHFRHRHALLNVLLGLLLNLALVSVSGGAAPEAKETSEIKWDKETAAFLARNEESPFKPNGIVFVGSSSIRMWNLKESFPNHRTLNCGFGGSQISDSLVWFDRVLAPYHPRLVVFYAGGNDLNAGKSPETVAGDARRLFEKIHQSFPKTRVLFISSAPNPKRWEQIEQVRALNSLVKAICGEMTFVTYVDVHHAMLGDDGQPLPDIYRDDRLHMNPMGYAIWNRIILPLLGDPD